MLKIPSVCHLLVVELHLPCCQLPKSVQKRNRGIALNNLRKAHVVGNVAVFSFEQHEVFLKCRGHCSSSPRVRLG